MNENNENQDKVKVFEDEKEILLDHDYDGIKELDHPLPSWWLGIFYVTIIFSIGYYVYYTFMDGPTLTEEYKTEIANVEEAQKKWEEKNNSFNMDEYNAWVNTPKAKKIAKKTYRRKCKACHGPDGGGGVGPNLADNYWKNGDGSVEAIYKVVDKGVVDKGMEAWGPKIGKEKVMAVVKYVKDFQGTTPTNPKEPEGKLYE
ncbi:MAG: cbb3-type cytochrome c oxidase N-terminal domain-containing protein [Bacteriovoracaceae bacterium]|jgi:cytochrome c oxidase cbb3-type subunit 3|nr:cbb3-type cytochrome c oxidase N-terminal domain-containing protein [Bacteriovoracaceae bacterium]